MATLDQGKVKREDISDGENLLEVPDDGRFDTLPEYYQEMSSILIEPIKVVNIVTSNSPNILHPATSLSEHEKKNCIEFFKKRNKLCLVICRHARVESRSHNESFKCISKR